MTRRVLTDAERIASIREVIEAARGDWHEATALLSVGADINWLLARAALSPGPEPVAGLNVDALPDAFCDLTGVRHTDLVERRAIHAALGEKP